MSEKITLYSCIHVYYIHTMEKIHVYQCKMLVKSTLFLITAKDTDERKFLFVIFKQYKIYFIIIKKICQLLLSFFIKLMCRVTIDVRLSG